MKKYHSSEGIKWHQKLQSYTITPQSNDEVIQDFKGLALAARHRAIYAKYELARTIGAKARIQRAPTAVLSALTIVTLLMRPSRKETNLQISRRHNSTTRVCGCNNPKTSCGQPIIRACEFGFARQE